MSKTIQEEDCLVQGVRRATLIKEKEKSNQKNIEEKNLSLPKNETARATCAKGSIPGTDESSLMEKPKLPKTRGKKRVRRARTTHERPTNVGELEKSKSMHLGHLDPRMKNRFSCMEMIQHQCHKTRSCLAFSLSDPVLPLEEVFAINTSPGLRHSAPFTRIQKLPPIEPPTRRREQTSMAEPSLPEQKVRTFLPPLLEQPAFSAALSNSPTCLSQSAPPCYYHASPLISTRRKSHSFLSMGPPSASETSLYSSSPINAAQSFLSSSSSLGPTPPQPFKKMQPRYLFPASSPRPPNEKEGNQRQRRRPAGRRLFPLLNKIDVAPNHKKKDDIQLEMAAIQEVNSEKTEKEPFSQEMEAVSDKERHKIEDYQRLNPNRRKAICEELENYSNVMKINGQRYNMTMLRHELIQMSKAVTKYNTFRKSLSFFI